MSRDSALSLIKNYTLHSQYDENGKGFGYKNIPIGKNSFQQLIDCLLWKTIGFANKKLDGKTPVFTVCSFRRPFITLAAAAGLSENDIQTYSGHMTSSSAMAEHYVKQYEWQVRKEETDSILDGYLARDWSSW
eukprot:773194_1